MASARRLLDEMPEKGVKPDIVSYNILLDAYRRKKNEDGFEEILKEIFKKGLDLDVVTFNCRILAFSAKGKSAEAEELLGLMLWLKPTRLSFNAIIRGFCKEENMDSTMRVYERMKCGEEGALPNFDTYIALIWALVEKGEFRYALEVCRECLKKNLAPPFQAIKGLIDGLVKNSRIHDAKNIVEKMRIVTKGDAGSSLFPRRSSSTRDAMGAEAGASRASHTFSSELLCFCLSEEGNWSAVSATKTKFSCRAGINL